MRIDNINLFGAGTGTGTIPSSSFSATASLVTTASYAHTASFVVGGGGAFSSVSDIVITATTTAPTKATTRQADHIRWRSLGGKEYEIEMQYSHNSSTGATAGTGAYLFTLPNSLQFSTTFHSPSTLTPTEISDGSIAASRAFIEGSSGFVSNGNTRGTLVARAYDSTRFIIGNAASFGGSLAVNSTIGQTYLPLTTAALCFSMRFCFTAA